MLQMGEGGGGGGGGDFNVLPEGCIANVVSLTGPRDACRICLVSSTFKSAAQSDSVWERFLPPDYHAIISRSSLAHCDNPTALRFESKKDLFLYLCHSPVLIDEGKMSFWLDKWTGKKCYMLSAGNLMIVWGDTPRYWRWISAPEARFTKVAELISVCWLEVRGKINTSMLSPATHYAAFLVFKATTDSYGFFHPVQALVGVSGSVNFCKRTVYLDVEGERRQRMQIVPRRFGLFTRRRPTVLEAALTTENSDQFPKQRRDGWFEIMLGDFYNEGEGAGEGELEIKVLETGGGHWKGGIIVQGIEIRLKGDN